MAQPNPAREGKPLAPGLYMCIDPAATWYREGTLITRVLPDGRVLDVVPLTFGRARLVLSRDPLVNWYDDGW